MNSSREIVLVQKEVVSCKMSQYDPDFNYLFLDF